MTDPIHVKDTAVQSGTSAIYITDQGDVEGECNAHLYVEDDFNHPNWTHLFRCAHEAGHEGDHVAFGSRFSVMWKTDERKYCPPGACKTCWGKGGCWACGGDCRPGHDSGLSGCDECDNTGRCQTCSSELEPTEACKRTFSDYREYMKKKSKQSYDQWLTWWSRHHTEGVAP